MTDGRIFLGIAALICASAFLIGLRFSRMSEERIVGRHVQIELPAMLARGRTPVDQVHLIGRILMIAAPIMLTFFIALTFGLLGPVDGIQTIKI